LGSESGVEDLADEDNSDNKNKGSCEEAEAATASSVIENPRKKPKALPDIDENSEQPIINNEGSQKAPSNSGKKKYCQQLRRRICQKNKKMSLKCLVPGKDGSLILKSR
jgi:hypothetical protein